MSEKTHPDLQAVLSRYQWLGADPAAEPVKDPDWPAIAQQLFQALEASIQTQQAEGLCRACGRALGSYCVQCAWPHRRKKDRQSSD